MFYFCIKKDNLYNLKSMVGNGEIYRQSTLRRSPINVQSSLNKTFGIRHFRFTETFS